MRVDLVTRRRALIGMMLAAPCFVSCRERHVELDDGEPFGRFKGTGRPELIVDAVPGVKMEGVEVFDDRNTCVFTSSLISKEIQKGMNYSSPHIPEYIHVVWRRNATARCCERGEITYDGPIAGDYIVPIGPRIPDTVLDDIRAHGGGLRFKIRLKPDGVLFGWDVIRGVRIPGCDARQNLTCIGTEISSPGGDFLETRY